MIKRRLRETLVVGFRCEAKLGGKFKEMENVFAREYGQACGKVDHGKLVGEELAVRVWLSTKICRCVGISSLLLHVGNWRMGYCAGSGEGGVCFEICFGMCSGGELSLRRIDS